MTARKRKQKPEIAIIGSGRLGTTLGVALLHRGYPVRALVARRVRNARKAARLLDDNVQVLAAKELHLLRPTEVILITVPDDQIAGVAAELSRLEAAGAGPPTVFHTSGALSSEVLKPLRKRGWSTGSLHPLVSVSHAGVPLEGGFWSVEGDKSAVRLGKSIVRDLGGTSFFIRSEDKPLYHAAAVMVSGNVVALFDVALEMLAECGLKRQTAHNILLPLIASTVRNLETKDPAQALTGTFSRGDLETVKQHLNALKQNQDALELYRLLGKRSLKLTKKYPQITRLLNSV
jgi:predicted short-subunit dehydrogenase-like oxidoreductase (DUF2520 family)